MTRPKTWRDAVDNELVCTETATAETYDHDPLEGVRALIQWHIDTDRYFREHHVLPVQSTAEMDRAASQAGFNLTPTEAFGVWDIMAKTYLMEEQDDI